METIAAEEFEEIAKTSVLDHSFVLNGVLRCPVRFYLPQSGYESSFIAEARLIGNVMHIVVLAIDNVPDLPYGEESKLPHKLLFVKEGEHEYKSLTPQQRAVHQILWKLCGSELELRRTRASRFRKK